MKEIFDNYVETSFDGFQQATSKFKEFEENYKKYFPADLDQHVLDIGIGRGEMLKCMRDWGHKYQGVDISPSTVKFCKTLQLNCEVTEDTANWLKNHKEKFSLITCLDVLEHVPRNQTIDFLKAIRSSLKNGGIAIIQVPNLQSPFGYLHHFNDFTHVTGFVEHSLSQVLLTAGFKDFIFQGFEEVFPTTLKQRTRLIIRYFYRKIIRFFRMINNNPNPKVLDPVMFVVAKK
jgi:2-polyprenyl-3-methyl-5-hydroxy-6-metoxy-1,4-benzoquinol methylase